MQPTIIRKEKLLITGLTGDGQQTCRVWGDFEGAYDANPFPKANEHGYEIRFWSEEKPVPEGSDIHVGFLAKDTDARGTDGFTTITLPLAEYAVFDVHVAKGYDSGNEEMDKWLEDNSSVYKPLLMGSMGYIVECYNDDKFKGGDKPDSVVEMWLPVERVKAPE